MAIPPTQPPLTPINPGLTNPQEPSVIKSMPKIPYLLVAVIVTIASAVLIAWAFFKPVPTQTPNTSQTQEQANEVLPIALSNEKVDEARLTYSFSAALLKEIRTTPKGPQLITSLKGYGIKENFILNSKTKIVFFDQTGKETPASVNDLKVNQGIRITAEYDLKKKTWTVKKVGIKLEQTNSATGATKSAQPK